MCDPICGSSPTVDGFQTVTGFEMESVSGLGLSVGTSGEVQRSVPRGVAAAGVSVLNPRSATSDGVCALIRARKWIQGVRNRSKVTRGVKRVTEPIVIGIPTKGGAKATLGAVGDPLKVA